MDSIIFEDEDIENSMNNSEKKNLARENEDGKRSDFYRPQSAVAHENEFRSNR